MMTQLQAAIATHEQAIAQQEFEKYILTQAEAIAPDVNFSFQALPIATETILRHALALASEKQKRSRTQYKKLLSEHGWLLEDKKYLKVAAAFGSFSPQDLAQIEPNTLFMLAKNSKKYQPVIDQLQNTGEVTQQAVRELIKQQRKSREPKLEKPSIWRRAPTGGRYCQIPPIHEEHERTGVTLQQMMDSEGLTAQQIVAEAISLRQAYQQGRLVLVDDDPMMESQLHQSLICEMNSDQIDPVGTDEEGNCWSEHIEKPPNSNNIREFQAQEHSTAEVENTEELDKQQLIECDCTSVTAVRDDNSSSSDNVLAVDDKLRLKVIPEPEFNSGTNSISQLKSNYVVKQSDTSVEEVIGASLPVEENPLTSTQIAQMVKQAATWSEVVRITQNCPHELKSAAWEMLNPQEKCRIHQLKNQHLEQLALMPQVGNKVYWMNCPAHLTNWQPFSITSIQGQEAMLDICAYPVPLAQLQVCSTF
jgi:hypothetical protein